MTDMPEEVRAELRAVLDRLGIDLGSGSASTFWGVVDHAYPIIRAAERKATLEEAAGVAENIGAMKARDAQRYVASERLFAEHETGRQVAERSAAVLRALAEKEPGDG